jgi:hypothetical protein
MIRGQRFGENAETVAATVPKTPPDRARPKSWREVARVVLPETAVAIVSHRQSFGIFDMKRAFANYGDYRLWSGSFFLSFEHFHGGVRGTFARTE